MLDDFLAMVEEVKAKTSPPVYYVAAEQLARAANEIRRATGYSLHDWDDAPEWWKRLRLSDAKHLLARLAAGAQGDGDGGE